MLYKTWVHISRKGAWSPGCTLPNPDGTTITDEDAIIFSIDKTNGEF